MLGVLRHESVWHGPSAGAGQRGASGRKADGSTVDADGAGAAAWRVIGTHAWQLLEGGRLHALATLGTALASVGGSLHALLTSARHEARPDSTAKSVLAGAHLAASKLMKRLHKRLKRAWYRPDMSTDCLGCNSSSCSGLKCNSVVIDDPTFSRHPRLSDFALLAISRSIAAPGTGLSRRFAFSCS